MSRVALTVNDGFEYGGGTEFAIVQWYVSVGQGVERGQVLFIYKTSKAAVEYESPQKGTLVEIKIPGVAEPDGTVDPNDIFVDEIQAECRGKQGDVAGYLEV